MAHLSIRLLGAPSVERDGALVAFDTRKATALLAYLVVTGERPQRDALTALLWPDYDQAGARAALRRTLSSLRKGIGEEFVDASHESIGLAKNADLWADVQAFRSYLEAARAHDHLTGEACAQCLEALAHAAELYRADFLSGFGLRDSASFDDWQFFLGDELRQEMAWALEQLASAYAAGGDYEPAIASARRWLALDPLREEAHRQLMSLYAWAGQRNAALRQYRACVRILEQELGVAPLDETTQLYQDILGNRLAPTHAPAAPPMPMPAGAEVGGTETAGRITLQKAGAGEPLTAGFTYPMIGRAAEWEALLLCHNAAKRKGWLAVVEGEAGIGKTRLAEDFVKQAGTLGARLFQARCYQGEANLAFGPFIHGLGVLLGDEKARERLAGLPAHWLVEAGRLQPQIFSLAPDMPAPSPLDRPGAQGRFFEGMRQVLCGLLSGKVAGILLLDDLQWADTASLDLVAYLVNRLELTNLLLLLTWSGSSNDNAARILHLIAGAQRARRCTRLRLERLTVEQIDELVRATPGTATGEQFSLRLHRESEGLPFFAVAYLNSALQEGQVKPSQPLQLPGDVRNLLQARISILDETARQLLATAAVIGRSFDYQSLRETSGRSDFETVSGLETLLAHGLITENSKAPSDGEIRYDFTHERLRELVYEETSLARRQLLHRRVAETLLSSAKGRREPGAMAALVAYHYQQSGHSTRAAEYYQLAGEHARSLYANEAALAHFQAALAAGHANAAGLYEAIGDIQTLTGQYENALLSYERAAALCDPIALPGVESKLGNIHQRRGDYALAICHFQAALEGIPEGERPETQARLLADWSRSAHHLGQSEQALALGQKALALADSVDHPEALAKAHNMLGILARNRGEMEAARHHLESSLKFSERTQNPEATIAALNNLALVYAESDAIETAIDYTTSALEICEKIGDRHRSAALYDHLAELYHHSGQSERAMEYLKAAVKIFGEVDQQSSAPRPRIWMLIEW